MTGRRSDDPAHIPFYKDERVLGSRVTASSSVRMFIVAIAVSALLFSWALLKVYSDEGSLHDYVSKAHDSRVADQKNTQVQINHLACYIVANIPDKAAPIIPKFRKQYRCPPYGKDPNFRLYKQSQKKKPAPKKPAPKNRKA